MSYSAAEQEFLADSELVETLARVNAHPERRRTRPSPVVKHAGEHLDGEAAVGRQAAAGDSGGHE
jgi:hypothetical protein